MRRAMNALPAALVVMLVLVWLLLNQTLAPGHLLLGFALALPLTWASMKLRPLWPRLRRPWLLPLLAAIVLGDIVRSNVGVARIVLGLVRGREIRSGFVHVPLDLRDPHGLAVLAAIVTSTPGTVWADLARDGRRVTLHVLDLRDEREWVNWIKSRYERRLKRIFE